MSEAGNPLGIRDIEGVMYIPLDVISEEEIERLRAENLEANTVDSTADDLGPSAPGVKADAEEQIKAQAEEALANPLTADGETKAKSPSDALG